MKGRDREQAGRPQAAPGSRSPSAKGFAAGQAPKKEAPETASTVWCAMT